MAFLRFMEEGSLELMRGPRTLGSSALHLSGWGAIPCWSETLIISN